MTYHPLEPNPYITQATWFVDPTNSTGLANDNNTGIDATHPVLSYNGGIVSKWGTTSPVLRQNTTITWLSSQPTGGADPVIATPICVGTTLVLTAPLPTAVHTGTLSGVIAKNQSMGQILTADLGFAATPGMLIKNTTIGKTSFAWVWQNVSGTTFKISQPLAPNTPPIAESPPPTEVDTWANGDTFSAYTLISVNITHTSGNAAMFDAIDNFRAPTQIYHINIASPDGFDSDNNLSMANTSIIECSTNCVVDDAPDFASDYINAAQNCFFGSSVTSRNTQWTLFGGILRTQFVGSVVPWSFGYGAILDNTGGQGLVVGGSEGQGQTIPYMLEVFIAGVIDFQNMLSAAETLTPVSKIWGPGTLNGKGLSFLLYSSTNTAVGTFLNAGGLTLNGQSVVNTLNGTTGENVIGISLTPKALDIWGGLNVGSASVTNGANAIDWSSFAFIYVDGVSGNDQNQGFYTTSQGSPAAIKTHAELFRRLGSVWKPKQDTTLNYINYPTDTAQFRFNFNGIFKINVNGPALTQNSSGTFSAVTVRNNSANTPYDVQDGSVVTTGDVARRIRITSGARAGARAWVAKSTGAGHRRTSEWVTFDPINFLTAVVPQAGDTYAVESSSKQLKISCISIENSSGYGQNGIAPYVYFNDIDFAPNVVGGTTIFTNSGVFLIFQDCIFMNGEWQMRTLSKAGDNFASSTLFANCCLSNIGINNFFFTEGTFVENFWWGGLGFGQLAAAGAGGVNIDFNFLAQANNSFCNPAAIDGGQLNVTTMGVMDWHNITGGIIIFDALVALSNPVLDGYASLWGSSSNSGSIGVNIGPGGSLRYQPTNTQISITGIAGDFNLAGASSARAWDDTAGAYTANIACTWTNLLGGSLLDNAHSLTQNAHAYKNSGNGQP